MPPLFAPFYASGMPLFFVMPRLMPPLLRAARYARVSACAAVRAQYDECGAQCARAVVRAGALFHAIFAVLRAIRACVYVYALFFFTRFDYRRCHYAAFSLRRQIFFDA